MTELSRMLVATLAAGVAFVTTAMPTQEAAAQARNLLRRYATDEVLVVFKENAQENIRRQSMDKVGGTTLERILTPVMRRKQQQGMVRLRVRKPVSEAVQILEADPNVEYAEPNWIYTKSVTPNDPQYVEGKLWGLYSADRSAAIGPSGTTNVYGTQAEQVWDSGNVGSKSIYVGVIDEGVQNTHPDLAANIWANPFDPADGVDNDGNGYVDDRHGWDFLNQDNSVYDARDGDNHGTHVAGTIGGVGNNRTGVVGMCWNVNIIAAKFLGPDGGTTADAIKAVDYLVDLKTRHGLNIVAINASWGGGGYSRGLHEAILRAAKQGILFVAAAGNETQNIDTSPSYPANYSTLRGTATETAATYDSVLSVAAITANGGLAGFSNYGATNVDLGAPGANILSTVADGYAAYSGTSMATPHVTGAVALYANASPGATASETRKAILNAVVPTSSLSGRTVTGGRLDVSRFMRATAPTTDIVVTALSVPTSVRQGETATLTANVSNEGSAPATFNVALTATAPAGASPGRLSAAQSVSLGAGEDTTLRFTWDTAETTPGVYALVVTAAPIPGDMDTNNNRRSANVTVLASSADPVITSITPNSMRVGTERAVVVAGRNFARNAKVTFVGGEGAAPRIRSSTVSADGTQIKLRVRIPTGAPRTDRYWDVVVTNPNGTSSRLVRGFTVTVPTPTRRF